MLCAERVIFTIFHCQMILYEVSPATAQVMASVGRLSATNSCYPSQSLMRSFTAASAVTSTLQRVYQNKRHHRAKFTLHSIASLMFKTLSKIQLFSSHYRPTLYSDLPPSLKCDKGLYIVLRVGASISQIQIQNWAHFPLHRRSRTPCIQLRVWGAL